MRTLSLGVLAIASCLVLATSLASVQGAGVFVPNEPTQEEAALIAAIKEKKVTMSFQNTPFRDAAAFLSTLLDINVVPVGEQALKREVSLEVKNVLAESAVRLLVGPDGGYAVIDNCLCLGTAKDVTSLFQKKAIIPENPKEAEVALYGKLKEKRLDVSFAQTPMDDAVNFLRNLAQCNMVADSKAVENRMVTLTVKNSTLDTIVRLICDPDLNYGIGQEVIYISTDKGVKKMLGTR